MSRGWDQKALDEFRARAYASAKSFVAKAVKCNNEGPESDLHRKVADYCDRQGWIYIHSRMDRETTVAAGTPDFIIAADKGRWLAVELKTSDGKLSEAQVRMHARASALGHEWHVVRSYGEFIALCLTGTTPLPTSLSASADTETGGCGNSSTSSSTGSSTEPGL